MENTMPTPIPPAPIHPIVAEIVSKLDPDLQEEFQERAAILEFEAAMLRDHAECLALLDVLHRHPNALLKGTSTN